MRPRPWSRRWLRPFSSSREGAGRLTETPHIGALIPVRLDSERLPGKALKLINGRPVIHHLLDRAVACRYLAPERVVVCTTEAAEDDPLVEAVEDYGAVAFRGDRDDIIKRFHSAMLHFGFDAVVQIDGDDPLTDPLYMDLTMERLLSDPELGIVRSEGLPLGVNCKSFSRAAMISVINNYDEGQNDTGFIYFFTKTDLVKQDVVGATTADHVHDEARLTLDYDIDLELFRRIFEALEADGHMCTLSEVVRYLRQNPDVLRINHGLDEEYWQRTRDKANLGYIDRNGRRQIIAV
jgi:spore coat polysaccharide biosynthesis protein SpsF